MNDNQIFHFMLKASEFCENQHDQYYVIVLTNR